MNKKEYERLKILLLLFDETEAVRTSGEIFEEDWNDGNADSNGWT